MSDFSNLLQMLYKSKTITPSYNIPQILYAILLIGKEPNGIGRYKLKKHIELGEGATKTLITRLKEANIIHLEHNRQQGHVLTKQGEKLYNQLLNMISYPQFLRNMNDDKGNLYVIGEVACYVSVKKKFCTSIPNIQLAITQRDEAIKIGGSGASSLIYNGQRMVFPGQEEEKHSTTIDGIDTSILKKGDVIIIGGGRTKNLAVLATLAAAFSIFKEKF